MNAHGFNQWGADASNVGSFRVVGLSLQNLIDVSTETEHVFDL